MSNDVGGKINNSRKVQCINCQKYSNKRCLIKSAHVHDNKKRLCNKYVGNADKVLIEEKNILIEDLV